MIEIQNLTKEYNLIDQKLIALDHINFTISRGEFLVILGQSGSGKSTLLNLLCGIDTPTEGEIIFENRNISKLKNNQLAKYRKHKIGIVFQKFNLINSMTVYENVALPLKFSGKKTKAQRKIVDKVLSEVGLLERSHSIPGKLSGGQQQRVAIARALVNNPEVLICDEPTGNLDSKTGTEILGLLKKLNEAGKTIIMVTHNDRYVKYADRIIEMMDGKIIREEKVITKENTKEPGWRKDKNSSPFSIVGIALKNLRRRKVRFVLTSFGIAIGAMAIVILVSFGAGLQKTEMSMLSDMAQVEEITVSGDPGINANMSLVQSSTSVKAQIQSLNDQTITDFKGMPKVAAVYAEPSFSAEANFNNKTAQFFASTSAPIKYISTSQKDKVKFGRYFISDDENSVVVPYDLISILGLSAPENLLGKEIIVKNFNDYMASATATKVAFSQKEYTLKVVGIFGQNDKTVSTQFPNATGVKITKELKGNELEKANPVIYDSLIVRAESPKDVSSISDNLTKKGYGTTSFNDIAKQVNKIFGTMQIVLGVIGSVALLVASLGVINTMLMAILERTREIGIMKAIGARNKDIRQIFLFESVSIGLVGGIIGLILGYFGSKAAEAIVSYYANNAFGDAVKFYIPPYLVLFVLFFSMFISALAGLVPANRAAKLNPVEALRDE